MDKRGEFELLKDLSLSEGGKLLMSDIRTNKESSDTIFVMPLIDNGMIISPIADEMLKRQGYVQALNWILGILEHYQTAQYEELDDEI